MIEITFVGRLTMKIKMYWPNCNLNFKGAEFNGKDALFLECSLAEAKKQLFYRLTSNQIEECMRDYNLKRSKAEIESGIESNKVCFLITMDQETLLPEPWWFPFAGQWNGYSPFRKIRNIEIEVLEELSNSIIQIEDDNKL